jgi:peptide/nickel transport system permease protein
MSPLPADGTAAVPGRAAPARRAMRRGPLLIRRLLRQNAVSIAGEIVVIALLFVGVFGPMLAPHDPLSTDILSRLSPPGPAHPFGTDQLGRDVYSRVLFGARATLLTVAFVLAVVLALGIPLGAIAGFVEGWPDEVIMRIGDLILAFPPLVLAMALVVAMGPSLTTAMLAVAIVRWPRYARLVRAQVLTIKHRPYVEAEHSLGGSQTRTIVRHILPNCLDPVLVRATVDAGYIILTTASLSFIGLGAQPPSPEWGAMVSDARAYMINNWWVGVFPGVAIMLAVTGLTLVGDEIRDRFDPTLRGAR